MRATSLSINSRSKIRATTWKETHASKVTPLQMLDRFPHVQGATVQEDRPGNIKTQFVHSLSEMPLSGEDFHNPVTTTADDPATVAAPNDATYPLAAHQPVTGDFMRAASLLEVPKPETSVVSGRNQLAPVRRERKRSNRRWMS